MTTGSTPMVRVFTFGEVHVIEIDGSLDHLLSIRLTALLEPLVKRHGTKVLVDLSLSPTIGSMGYVVLVRSIEMARENGGQLEFCGLCPTARMGLQIMGFPNCDRASASREEALQRFS